MHPFFYIINSVIIMKKIFFIDLDHTFWDREVIPESAIEALKIARNHGHRCFVNTGRAKSGVPEWLFDLPFDGFIFSQGSEIIIDDKQILYKPLNVSTTKWLQQYAIDHDCAYGFEGSITAFADEKRIQDLKELAKKDGKAMGFSKAENVSSMTEQDYEQVMKMIVNFRMDRDNSDFEKGLPDTIDFSPFAIYGGEITSNECSKGKSIQIVKDYYSEDVTTVAIGDSLNDIEMLKAADISILMGNRLPGLDEYADYITDTLKNDGFYKAIIHYL